jgi:hypothetical protein
MNAELGRVWLELGERGLRAEGLVCRRPEQWAVSDRRSRGTRRRLELQRPMRRRRWVDVDCGLGEQSVEDVRIEVERALGLVRVG